MISNNIRLLNVEDQYDRGGKSYNCCCGYCNERYAEWQDKILMVTRFMLLRLIVLSQDLVVRSREVKDEGYEIEHDGKLITVFSAPNYCNHVISFGYPLSYVQSLFFPFIWHSWGAILTGTKRFYIFAYFSSFFNYIYSPLIVCHLGS